MNLYRCFWKHGDNFFGDVFAMRQILLDPFLAFRPFFNGRDRICPELDNPGQGFCLRFCQRDRDVFAAHDAPWVSG